MSSNIRKNSIKIIPWKSSIDINNLSKFENRQAFMWLLLNKYYLDHKKDNL